MIDYFFFRELPIADVLDALGIARDHAGKFICPSHEDVHASASINPKAPNRWRCFSCGANGTALDLVMAVEDCSINKAAYILDDLGFKGGIIQDNEGISKEALAPPEITRKDLKKIGLVHNPFSEYVIRISQPDPKDERRVIITPTTFTIIAPENSKNYIYDLQTAATMIADKIFEYKKVLRDYSKSVFDNFPLLGVNEATKEYINKTTQENVAYFDTLENNFRQYYLFLEKVLFDNGLEQREANIGTLLEENGLIDVKEEAPEEKEV